MVIIEEKMFHVFTEGISVRLISVDVKFNGLLKYAGTVSIRVVETFLRFKSREGGYLISRRSSTLNFSGRRRSYGVYIYYVKG